MDSLAVEQSNCEIWFLEWDTMVAVRMNEQLYAITQMIF